MSINHHIDRQTKTIDGVTFKNTHSGQKKAYGDSFYEYEINSDLPAEEVERVCREKVVFGEEEDRGAGFDEEHELGGLFDGEEIGDGLLDVVVEDLEVFAAEAGDEMTGGVGYGDADVDAVYGYSDWRG